MGNIFSRRRPSPSPTSSPKSSPPPEHQLCPLHQRLKCLKDVLSRFKPNDETSRDALRKELQALSDECSKLLTSKAWHPKEREAIESFVVDTGDLVLRLRDFSDRRLALTPEKIAELSVQINAESGDIEALVAALQKESDCPKTPGATPGTSRWISLLKNWKLKIRRRGCRRRHRRRNWWRHKERHRRLKIREKTRRRLRRRHQRNVHRRGRRRERVEAAPAPRADWQNGFACRESSNPTLVSAGGKATLMSLHHHSQTLVSCRVNYDFGMWEE